MKNMKLIAGVVALLSAVFNFASKGQTTTDFQVKLSKAVKVDTAVYLVDNQTITKTPNKNIG